MSDTQHDSLPSWWFEVDEVDDIDTNTSLLQELDIDLPQIYKYADNSYPFTFSNSH